MKENKLKGSKRKQLLFDGIGEVLDRVRPITGNLEHNSQNGCYNDRWAGASFTEALELASHGWAAGTAEISARLNEIKHREELTQVGYQWDVTGDLFDIGAMLTGQPEHWLSPDMQPERRVYRIMVNVSASASVSPEQIKNKGAAIVALVDKLQEDPGAIVELYVANTARNCAGWSHIEWIVALGTTPLDMDTASYMIAHPSYLRRIGLALTEIDTGDPKGGGMYGYPTDIDDPSGYDLYIPHNYTGDGVPEFNSTEGAAAWVARKVQELTQREAA